MSVKIKLNHATDINVSRFHAAGFAVDSADPDLALGAIHMCMASLAWCTYSVLANYGARIGADAEDMNIRLRWRYSERPHRLGHVDMAIRWPNVPESRLDAATRVAASCTLHNTLLHGLEIETAVDR